MAGRPYDKRAWRKLRRQHLREFPLCAMCLARGRAVPAVDVHHRVALRDGGELLDRAGLESLCHEDHSRVTAAEKTGRAVVDVDAATGMPIGDHWWTREREK